MSAIVIARALYDNDAETEDELSFKKGDVITVLETDFDGMVGWWLCSLGDKQGVAPGNRLRLLSYIAGGDDVTEPSEIYDIPVAAAHHSTDYDIPKPHSNSHEYEDYAIPKPSYHPKLPLPESQRHGFVLPSPNLLKTCDIRNSDSSDGLVTNEIYDAPARWSSERSSDEFRFSGEGDYEEMTYDVPLRNSSEFEEERVPQGFVPINGPVLPPKASAINSQGLENQEIYDHPNNFIENMTEIQAGYSKPDTDVYDTIPALPNEEKAKVSGLLRSLSFENDSAVPMGRPPSFADKYDIPPTIPDDIYDVPPTNYDEIYDVIPGEPSESCYDVITTTTAVHAKTDGNNNPPSTEASTSTKFSVKDSQQESVQEGVYDNYEFEGLLKEMEAEQKKSAAMLKHVEHKVDMSRRSTALQNTAVVKLEKSMSNESDDYVDYQEIYGMGKDEPVKTTKTEEKHSAPSCAMDRIHMDKVRELHVTHSVAMTNLDKLQQAVDVAVTKLLSFVTEDWRQPENLALNVRGIRDISGKVKVALRLLTEFGLGSLVKSDKLPDPEGSKKIRDALEPLLETYYTIKSCILHLDESEWKSAYEIRDGDHLNIIAKEAEGIPCAAYNLGAVISNLSFKLFTDNQGTPSKVSGVAPPVGRTSSPVIVQKESVRGLDAKKVESKQVSKQRLTTQPATNSNPPPTILPKPKRKPTNDQNKNGNITENSVSELTNNLLNEIEDLKQRQKPTFRRQGSKRLSPKTVRRLCSIGLKSGEKHNDKLLEDVSATPPKPSRKSTSSNAVDEAGRTSPMTQDDSQRQSDATVTQSDPGERLCCFIEKMDEQFVSLKNSIKNFVDSVRQCQKPKVFVAHSKFIVLSAHKLVYIGDGALRSQNDAQIKDRVSTATNSLSNTINEFVEGIKIAARQYPEEDAMNTMIRSAAKVTERALDLHKTLKLSKIS